MDITVPEAMATLCRGIHDRWGSLDIWAHTAIHAAPLTPTSHIDSRDMAKSITANITATATLINYVAPCWAPKARRCSLTTRARAKFFGSYGATKAAQIALARSWQAETTKTGPRVVIAQPDPMPTATRARFFPGEDRAPWPIRTRRPRIFWQTSKRLQFSNPLSKGPVSRARPP